MKGITSAISERIFFWESITPLPLPVVPDVNTRSAIALGSMAEASTPASAAASATATEIPSNFSSMRNKPVDERTMIIGEVGLAGEIRGVSNIMQRVKEADKLGFRQCIIPASNYDVAMEKLDIKITKVSNIVEALGVI